MKTRRRNVSGRECRLGFTLIELLVVISIIATLMALILPAIQRARGTARKMECLSNMRQVGMAVYNIATNDGNRVPHYGLFTSSDAAAANFSDTPVHSWVIDVLPYLDRRDIYDRWDDDADLLGNDADSLSNLALTDPDSGVHVEALTCPDDVRVAPGAGLSFVLNAGYINAALPGRHRDDAVQLDWNADTTIADAEDNIASRRSGVCWRDTLSNPSVTPTPPPGDVKNSLLLDEIYDGASQSILLSENLNAGSLGWGNPDHTNVAFVLPIDPAGTSLGVNFYRLAPLDPAVANDGRINRFRAGPEGTPYLSSEHIGGVNVVMCDGSGRFISEHVDDNVLARLVSPAATAPLPATINRQDPLSENNF